MTQTPTLPEHVNGMPTSLVHSAKTVAMNGVNELIMGPTGVGKTRSLATLVNAGIEVFYIGMENGIESLIGVWADEGKPIPPNLHWANAMGSAASFEEQLFSAKQANLLSLEGLAKMVDPNKSKYDQMQRVLKLLSNFVDERTGQSFGPVDKWSTSRALAIDGLTGLGVAAMSNIIGGKPVKSMSDWGTAQTFIMNLLRALCDNCPCHFILISHVEREVDQVLGGVKIMPSTLGKSIAGLIAPMFSDVILAEKQGDKLSWNTASTQADLKARNLPVRAGMPQDFGPIIQTWQRRMVAFQQSNGAPQQ